MEDAENGLTDFFRALLAQQYEQLVEWDRRIEGYDRQIHSLFRSHEACGRIAAVEGIGAVGATALVAAFGDARQLGSGRQFAAARHPQARRPLHPNAAGARAVVQAVLAKDKTDTRSRWTKRRVADRGKNRAAVALANKNARILWALLTRGETYRVAA